MQTQCKNSSFMIRSFMTETMGLSGSELLVFALIWSFSPNGIGKFYGTQEYLARNTALSLSTVRRALRSLEKQMYIERLEHDDRCAYRPTDIAVELAAGLIADDDIRSVTGYGYVGKKGEKSTEHEFEHIKLTDNVYLTQGQIDELVRLVGEKEFEMYVLRLDAFMTVSGHTVFYPYKTLRRWIYKESEI